MSRPPLLTPVAMVAATLVACSAPPAPDIPARTSPITVVSLYAQHCTECHVRDQRNFAAEPYTMMDDAELGSLVRKQAFQEANVKLDPAQADAMTAFFKAMIAKEPFVVVNEQQPGALLGEATIGAQVTLRWPTEQVVAQRTEGKPSWRARVPEGLRVADATIEARQGTTVTKLNPTQASHSHATTSPAPRTGASGGGP